MRIYLQLSLIDSSIVLTSCEGSLKVQGKDQEASQISLFFFFFLFFNSKNREKIELINSWYLHEKENESGV